MSASAANESAAEVVGLLALAGGVEERVGALARVAEHARGLEQILEDFEGGLGLSEPAGRWCGRRDERERAHGRCGVACSSGQIGYRGDPCSFR